MTTYSSDPYWERQYNPRVSVANANDYFMSWQERARETRARISSVELSYGDHERERLDLFRPSGSRGTLVFLHGGYWRAFGKEDVSWIAQPFCSEGISVAVLSYPLLPHVRLPRISSAVASAMRCLDRSALTSQERQRIVLAGHSAGGHLAAYYQSLCDEEQGVRPADAIVCISGLFDLLPLQHTQMLASFGLGVMELYAASPLFAPPPASGDVVLAFGADEPTEFRLQSERLAQAWHVRSPQLVSLQGRNHFSALEALAEPSHDLCRRVLRTFD